MRRLIRPSRALGGHVRSLVTSTAALAQPLPSFEYPSHTPIPDIPQPGPARHTDALPADWPEPHSESDQASQKTIDHKYGSPAHPEAGPSRFGQTFPPPLPVGETYTSGPSRFDWRQRALSQTHRKKGRRWYPGIERWREDPAVKKLLPGEPFHDEVERYSNQCVPGVITELIIAGSPL